MSNVEQIIQEIQTLPIHDRLRVIERVVHDLADTSVAQQQAGAAEGRPSLLGLFADEPELIEEVCRTAMEDRKHDRLRTAMKDAGDEGPP